MNKVTGSNYTTPIYKLSYVNTFKSKIDEDGGVTYADCRAREYHVFPNIRHYDGSECSKLPVFVEESSGIATQRYSFGPLRVRSAHPSDNYYVTIDMFEYFGSTSVLFVTIDKADKTVVTKYEFDHPNAFDKITNIYEFINTITDTTPYLQTTAYAWECCEIDPVSTTKYVGEKLEDGDPWDYVWKEYSGNDTKAFAILKYC